MIGYVHAGRLRLEDSEVVIYHFTVQVLDVASNAGSNMDRLTTDATDRLTLAPANVGLNVR